MSLVHTVEDNGILTVAQANGPGLIDLRNIFIQFLGGPVCFLVIYWLIHQAGGSTAFDWLTGPEAPRPVFLLVFFTVGWLYLILRAINQLFWKEKFIFDRNEGLFIRNGSTVGPLNEIRRVTPQVTKGLGRNPMFRLALELPGRRIVVIAETNYVAGYGDFKLSGNGFAPNKQFAMCEPWLDCDKQNLVPFIPPEIVQLRQQIVTFLQE